MKIECPSRNDNVRDKEPVHDQQFYYPRIEKHSSNEKEVKQDRPSYQQHLFKGAGENSRGGRQSGMVDPAMAPSLEALAPILVSISVKNPLSPFVSMSDPNLVLLPGEGRKQGKTWGPEKGNSLLKCILKTINFRENRKFTPTYFPGGGGTDMDTNGDNG